MSYAVAAAKKKARFEKRYQLALTDDEFAKLMALEMQIRLDADKEFEHTDEHLDTALERMFDDLICNTDQNSVEWD